jgi:hypothetical protein
MFLGHFGVGLAAKKAAPQASLGWLIAAALLLDLFWPIFLLLGWESVRIDPGNTVVTPFAFESYPISHSMATVAGWSLAMAGVYWVVVRDEAGAWLVGALVMSHWLLDFVVHGPDLPLYPGGPKMGLGLWDSLLGTLAVEAGIFIAGVWIYSTRTRATSAGGKYGWWAFVAFLVVILEINLFGPPPENVRQVAWVTLALWVMPLWAWAFDRLRTANP